MDTNKILTASLDDLVFDNRNKDYGAYELRNTYQRRVTKAMLLTGGLVLLAFSSYVMANKLKPVASQRNEERIVTLIDIPIEPPTPEQLPPPEPKQPDPPPRSEKFIDQFKIVDEQDVDPPPSTDDLVDSQISDVKTDGPIDDGISPSKNLDIGTGIIEPPTKKVPDEPFTAVEVQARFDGNWEKFLLRNLNAQVPVDNGAEAGRYTVFVQFVVDVDGTVSDIKPLTSLGFGMEQEAVRVLRKAAKWIPAFQNGQHVKAYRKQGITFEITGSD